MKIRVLAFVATLLIGLVGVADPASAHTSSKAKPSNYHSSLDEVVPSIDGISLKFEEGGERLQLTNRSDKEVTILGYEDEPYLKVNKDGVFANTNSPAYYLNRSYNSLNPVPEGVSAESEPNWKKTSSGNVVLWHDHRTHWMSDTPHPLVEAKPNQRHMVIPHWTVSLRADAQPITATGKLAWIPASSPLPWYFAMAALLAAALAVVLFKKPPLAPWFAAAMFVLIAVDLLHSLDGVMTGYATSLTRLGHFAEDALPSMMAGVLGGYGAVRMLRSKEDGPWFVLFASLIICILGGFTELSAMTASHVPSWLPQNATKVLITISAGLGLGLAIASVVIIRRDRAEVLDLDVASEIDIEN